MKIVMLLILVVSVIFNILMYIRHQKYKATFAQDKFDELTDKIKVLEEKVEKAKISLGKASEIVAVETEIKNKILEGIPTLDRRAKLEDRLRDLYDFWHGYYGNIQLFIGKDPQNSQAFFFDLSRKLKASELIYKLREKETGPFWDLLSRTSAEPLTDELKVAFIKMSIRMFDSIHSFQNSEASSHHTPNRRIIIGETTEEKEYQNAAYFTDIEEDSHLWSRRLARCLKSLGAEDMKIVFTGYKFPSKEETVYDEPAEEKYEDDGFTKNR